MNLKGEQRADRKERGFTLVEVMIAMVVLTVGLISVVGISGYVSRANTVSNGMSVLATAAQDQIDRMRAIVWTINTDNDPRLWVGGSLDDNEEDHFEIAEDTAAGDLIVRWRVVEGPGTTGDMRTITVRVVQEFAPPLLQEGYTVTTIISRS
jgi:prepilin-type N-terminal cleavage/methylation domain-containing protein